MKLLNRIIMICIFSLIIISCKKTKEQSKSSKTQQQEMEVKAKYSSLDTLSNYKVLKNPFDHETETYYSKYEGGQKLKEEDFFKRMKTLDQSIDSITLDKRKKTVKLYFSSKECLNCEGRFYHVSHNNYMNDYYRLEDIYASIFNNTSVNSISLFVDEEFHTYFPSGGGYIFLSPKNRLKKKWFLHDVDYYKIFSPNEMDHFIYQNEELEMLDKRFVEDKINHFKKNKKR